MSIVQHVREGSANQSVYLQSFFRQMKLVILLNSYFAFCGYNAKLFEFFANAPTDLGKPLNEYNWRVKYDHMFSDFVVNFHE